jgi:hypothetical protein
MKHMKKILTAVSLAVLAAGFWAHASKAQGMFDPRRTLFAVVQQHKLALEAPVGMCFLDQTDPRQAMSYAVLASMAERNNDQVLLGAFMACDAVNDPGVWNEGLPGFGLVTWLNPSIGPRTAMSRQDYLDMRESYFMQYVKARAVTLTPDKKVHRNGDNVSLGLTGREGDPVLRRSGTVIVSTTTLDHIPVEVTLHYSGGGYGAAPLPLPAELYPVMDKLMAQQIALNP